MRTVFSFSGPRNLKFLISLLYEVFPLEDTQSSFYTNRMNFKKTCITTFQLSVVTGILDLVLFLKSFPLQCSLFYNFPISSFSLSANLLISLKTFFLIFFSSVFREKKSHKYFTEYSELEIPNQYAPLVLLSLFYTSSTFWVALGDFHFKVPQPFKASLISWKTISTSHGLYF